MGFFGSFWSRSWWDFDSFSTYYSWNATHFGFAIFGTGNSDLDPPNQIHHGENSFAAPKKSASIQTFCGVKCQKINQQLDLVHSTRNERKVQLSSLTRFFDTRFSKRWKYFKWKDGFIFFNQSNRILRGKFLGKRFHGKLALGKRSFRHWPHSLRIHQASVALSGIFLTFFVWKAGMKTEVVSLLLVLSLSAGLPLGQVITRGKLFALAYGRRNDSKQTLWIGDCCDSKDSTCFFEIGCSHPNGTANFTQVHFVSGFISSMTGSPGQKLVFPWWRSLVWASTTCLERCWRIKDVGNRIPQSTWSSMGCPNRSLDICTTLCTISMDSYWFFRIPLA